jgi:hypothetical protein
MEQKRRVTAMDAILSKDPLDTNDIGYQEPEIKEVKPEREENHHQKPKNQY